MTDILRCLKLYGRYIVLGMTSVVFFCIYLYLYIGAGDTWHVLTSSIAPEQLIFNQPDEMANYYFIRRFALFGDAGEVEPLWLLSDSQVHPRSMTVAHGRLTPIGFPFFIIFVGLIVRIGVFLFGTSVFNILVVCVSPFVAVITPFFLYGAVSRFLGKRVGFVSALLLFFLPPWWYYASRPLQHNTLLVSFIILAIYMVAKVVCDDRQKIPIYAAVCGMAFAAAVGTRPSEFVWIICIALPLFLWTRKEWRPRDIVAACVGVLLVFALFVWSQIFYYGHPFGTGYIRPTVSGASATVMANSGSISLARVFFAPFGVHGKDMIKNTYYYVVIIFWPWAIAGFFGMFFLFMRSWKKKRWVVENVYVSLVNCVRSLWNPIFFSADPKIRAMYLYCLVYIFVSAFLIVYYGSWSFFDNVQHQVSIASSHARYFLPIYVGAIPGIAFVLVRLCKKKKVTFLVVVMILFSTLVWHSGRAVFTAFEGLKHVKKTVEEYYVWRDAVYTVVHEDAIVVTRYADKYLFPGRRVIPGFEADWSYVAAAELIQNGFQVYWFDLGLSKEEYPEFSGMLALYGMQVSDSILTLDNLELRELTNIGPGNESPKGLKK